MPDKRKKRCNYVNKSGERCNNPRSSKSKYCAMHKFLRTKLILTYLGIILTIVIAVLGFQSDWFIRKDIQELDNKLTQLMNSVNQTQSEKFKLAFPSGYQIFSATNDGIVLGPTANINDWIIDWDSIQLLSLTPTHFKISLPDMYYIPQDYTFTEGSFELPRSNIGEKDCFYGWRPGEICIELIDDIGDAVVCVLGFEQPKFDGVYIGLIHYDLAVAEMNVVIRDFKQYYNANLLNPNDIDIIYKLGTAYFQLGQFQSSVDKYNIVINSNPKHTLAYCYRALAYTMLYMDDEANDDFQLALVLGYDQATLESEIGQLKELRPIYIYPDKSIIDDILSSK